MSSAARRPQYLPLATLITLLVLVGCVGFFGPPGQEGPVPVVVNNSANATHMFGVWVVELPGNVTTYHHDGRTATYPLRRGLGTSGPGDNRTFKAVAVSEPSRLHGRFVLAPGEMNRSLIEEYPERFAVVVIVYQADDEIIEWVTTSCDGDHLEFVEVTSWNIEPEAHTSAASRCYPYS